MQGTGGFHGEGRSWGMPRQGGGGGGVNGKTVIHDASHEVHGIMGSHS